MVLTLLVLGLTLWIVFKVVKRYALHPTILAGPPSASAMVGNLGQIFSADGLGYHDEFLKKYGRVFQVHGLLGEKQIFTSDCAAISAILNDPDMFPHTEEYNSIGRLILGPGMIGAQGQQHKRLRKMLNPIFSTSNIRELTGAFFGIAHKLRDRLEQQLSPSSSSEVNILDWLSRAALDLIGIGGVGYHFGAVDGEENEYMKAAKDLLPTLTSVGSITLLIPHLPPSISFRRKILKFLPWPALKKFLGIIETMDRTAWEVYKGKKRQVIEKEVVEEKEGRGKDVMSLAIAANECAAADTRLTDVELVAQMGDLIFAGQDTTSGALCRTLQALSTKPELQHRLRKEIVEAKQAKRGEDLDYETLQSLPVLGAVCQEVLRLYPPVTWFDRIAHSDTSFPLASPITTLSGKTLSSIPVLKGTTVIMSVHGVNRDKAIWGDDADEFRVERWEEKEREERRAKVPSVWGSLRVFQSGPMACIGFRYAVLELKVVLSVLIESFEFAATGDDIEWTLSFTMSPRVRGKNVPGMPLFVRRAVTGKIEE
ncbi:cytochrome P450 [Neolentinus lepideus HHB14362 ss-1]|uniref:Cytochrome P450 n=1 Tax=Neolentinus lepideus HHB14362 ss-1 TaxID=1314782 RepID=A0A165RRT9_9AGAM|nr:cytochrome P450 [Neolentinus lepideus HHB14362 ss-1]